MKHLTAQNGLAYNVSLVYTIMLNTSQYRWFQQLFGNLVSYLNRINDEGIMIQFSINVNEELSKFGGFKDIPTKTEISKFMSIILKSESIENSDIVFLHNLVKHYIQKERFNHRRIPVEVTVLKNLLDTALNEPEIIVNNLVLSKSKK